MKKIDKLIEIAMENFHVDRKELKGNTIETLLLAFEKDGAQVIWGEWDEAELDAVII